MTRRRTFCSRPDSHRELGLLGRKLGQELGALGPFDLLLESLRGFGDQV